MSKFEETLKELNYEFQEQDGKKLTYRKRTQFSDLVLVIDLELKTIRPISVPVSFFLKKEDFITFYKEFELLQQDAHELETRSQGKLRVLE